MTDPRDDIDTWLNAQVEPLHPPPGTFERIRKQARRRKARRALVSAASAGAAASVIVLAVVALPRVVPSVLHLKSHAAGETSGAGGGPATSHPAPATSHPAASATPTPDHTTSHAATTTAAWVRVSETIESCWPPPPKVIGIAAGRR